MNQSVLKPQCAKELKDEELMNAVDSSQTTGSQNTRWQDKMGL